MAHNKILYLEYDHTLTYSNGSFSQSSTHDLKELFSGAIIPLSLLNIHTLKLPNHLSDEDQIIQVEIRMFEEGNLNSDEEYTIDFIRHDLPAEENFLFEVFALSHTKAADYFCTALTHSRVIDLITPGFMVYESLYDILPKQNDLFIYFGEDESFASIYQNGSYIAHRSLETLTSIAVETGFELARITSILSEWGLLEDRYPAEESGKFVLIQNCLTRNVERLVHTINQKRGLFGFTGIDHLYLDFQGNIIPGLESVFDAFGIHDVQISPLTRPNHKPQEWHPLLCAEYLSQRIGEKSMNLSPFKRKAPWYSRESGRFLAIAGMALFIALSIPLSLMWMISNEEDHKEQLQYTLEQQKQQTSQFSSILENKSKLLAQHENEIAKIKEEIVLIQGAQETADLISQMHLKRQQFLIDTTSELGRYHLGTLIMEQNGSKEMQLHVIADYRKRDDIAKLMSGLYTRGYQNVETHEIALDNKMYNARVKVTR
ncbi:MAG: hypothetical protein Q8K81_08360 [Sulfuricurvum sp.]|nr:hypothetical protein [Sulfuricurvum sp.]